MTDTTTPVIKPKWQLLLGMLPSFNQSLIVLVTATCTLIGTITTQRLTAKPAEKPATITVERIIERPAVVDMPAIAELNKAIGDLRDQMNIAAASKLKKSLK